MKFERMAVLAIFGSAMLFALHQYIAYIFERHGWKGMSAGDWGTWIGSIGTVCALAGTIWIATTESRRRLAQENAKGLLVASALAPRLELLANEIASFETRMDFTDVSTNGYKIPSEEAKYFLTIEFTPATTEELIALESMPNNCAKKLAYAQAQFATVQKQIARYADTVRHPEKPLPKKIAAIWANWARDLRGRFDVVARQCVQAARTHAAPPTQLELHGEGDDVDGPDF